MTPTSFIPKRPVSTEPVAPARRNHAVGLLSLLSWVVVIATVLSYGAVYLYQKTLTSQKVAVEGQIDQARQGIGTQFLGDMKQLDTRLSVIKQLIDNHVVVTPIFAALEQTTLHSVQYKSFTYALTTDPSTNATVVQVTLLGTAKSYATLALQSDAFAQNPLIKNPIFSELTVDDKTSMVSFKLVFSVDPAALSYESFINNLSASQAAPAQSTQQTPVTDSTQ